MLCAPSPRSACAVPDLLGIAVGIAAVILLTSIGEGIHRFLLGEFHQFGTNVISVHPGKTKPAAIPSGLPSSAGLTLDDARSLEHCRISSP